MQHLDTTTNQLYHENTKQTFKDLWLESNYHALIGIQGVKLSNYVLKGPNFMFGIRIAQDSEYTG